MTIPIHEPLPTPHPPNPRRSEGPQRLAFTIPIHEPLPPQYYVRVVSDSWMGAESVLELSFKGLVLPQVGGAGLTLVLTAVDRV